MSREPDWNELASAWQAQPAPAVDVEALRREATRRGRWLRFMVVTETLLTVVMVALIVLMFASRPTETVERVLFGGTAVLLLVYQGHLLWLRRREWRETGLGAGELLALEIRRCDTLVYYWRFGMWSVLGFWLAMLLGWAWALNSGSGPGIVLGLAHGLAANIVMIPLIGLFGAWRSHQARRRRARLQALQAELAGTAL